MNDLILLKTDVRIAEANFEEVVARLGGRLDLWSSVNFQATRYGLIYAIWEPKDSPGVFVMGSWGRGKFAVFTPPRSREMVLTDIEDCETVPPRELVA